MARIGGVYIGRGESVMVTFIITTEGEITISLRYQSAAEVLSFIPFTLITNETYEYRSN